MRRFLTHQNLIVAACLLFVLAAIIGVFIAVRSEPQPGEVTPTAVAPTSSPALIGPVATPGTPVATFNPFPTPARGSLPEMLSLTPDLLDDQSLALSDVAQYADIETWMARRSLTTPATGDDPSMATWQSELANLAMPEVVATRGLDSIWQDTYGFGLTQVRQIISVGQAPNLVIIFRGDWDAAALQASWVESGYQAVRIEGHTVWSLFPGDSVDLSAPASRPALGNLNNLTVLDDGTLIATSRIGRMTETMRVINGQSPSLAQNARVRSLLTTGTDPESFVTGMILKGSVLATSDTYLATPVGLSTPVPAPVADLLMIGMIDPHQETTLPVMTVLALYDSISDATASTNRSLRLLSSGRSPVTDRPYADRLRLHSGRIIGTPSDLTVVLLQFDLRNGVPDWLQIVEERDLGFLMWSWNVD